VLPSLIRQFDCDRAVFLESPLECLAREAETSSPTEGILSRRVDSNTRSLLLRSCPFSRRSADVWGERTMRNAWPGLDQKPNGDWLPVTDQTPVANACAGAEPLIHAQLSLLRRIGRASRSFLTIYDGRIPRQLQGSEDDGGEHRQKKRRRKR